MISAYSPAIGEVTQSMLHYKQWEKIFVMRPVETISPNPAVVV